MSGIDPNALARELLDAHASCQTIAVPPSARGAGFDLTTAYAVEAELVRLRRASGRNTAGVKVGYANKAVWRALKLDTLAWAHVYDDTVHYVRDGAATLSSAQMCSPKIEPEIIFKLKHPLGPDHRDAAAALAAVEWLALGFEVIDCVYADWLFQPADFVAAFGLHKALIVGEPVAVTAQNIPALVNELARFKVRLLKDGEVVQEGGGRNVLRSPALCLSELASAMPGQQGTEPLVAGDLVSTGTLTESQPIAAAQTWSASVDGIGLRDVVVQVTA